MLDSPRMPVLVSRCRRTASSVASEGNRHCLENHMKLKRHPLAWAISLALVPAAWAADPVELQSVVVSASGPPSRAMR